MSDWRTVVVDADTLDRAVERVKAEYRDVGTIGQQRKVGAGRVEVKYLPGPPPAVRLESVCPSCGQKPEDESTPLYLGATLNVSLTFEMTDDGDPSFITHTPSSDEIVSSILICKHCGWYREVDLDDVRGWLGEPHGQWDLCSVIADVKHPRMNAYNEG